MGFRFANVRRQGPSATGSLCGSSAAVLIGTMVAVGIVRGEPGIAAKPDPKRVLFDGKTLEGWKKTDFAHTGEVKVENGRIVLSVGNAMTGITTTLADLPRVNYELSYAAMRIEGVDFFAACTFPVGASYLTLVNGGWGGHVSGLSSLDGQDASENETGQPIKFENGKWYTFRLRVTDRAVRCWVDAKAIITLDTRNHQLGTRVETRANQPLGFASWESSGGLKGIEIRALTAAEIEDANKPE